MRTPFVLALAVLAAVGAGCPVQAQYDDPYVPAPGDLAESYEPAPEDYESDLSPHGVWYADATWGRVWRPRVYAGWQPYTDGYWGWTTWGWTWVSVEPWSWTFHYGRWNWAPTYGWVWIPGSVWGPAWVNWYWGNGYVGWAPYGVVGINNYVFVQERNFCSPYLRGAVVRDRYLPDGVRRHWHDRRLARGPDRDHIQRVGVHPVRKFDRKPEQTVAPWQRPGGRRVERPGDAGRAHVGRPNGQGRDGRGPDGRARDGRGPDDRSRNARPRDDRPDDRRWARPHPDDDGPRRNGVPNANRRRDAGGPDDRRSRVGDRPDAGGNGGYRPRPDAGRWRRPDGGRPPVVTEHPVAPRPSDRSGSAGRDRRSDGSRRIERATPDGSSGRGAPPAGGSHGLTSPGGGIYGGGGVPGSTSGFTGGRGGGGSSTGGVGGTGHGAPVGGHPAGGQRGSSGGGGGRTIVRP